MNRTVQLTMNQHDLIQNQDQVVYQGQAILVQTDKDIYLEYIEETQKTTIKITNEQFLIKRDGAYQLMIDGKLFEETTVSVVTNQGTVLLTCVGKDIVFDQTQAIIMYDIFSGQTMVSRYRLKLEWKGGYDEFN